MSTSVGTKSRKKQSSLSAPPELMSADLSDRPFEHSLLSLENACLRVIDGALARGARGDTERTTWLERFRNIATPVSLALAEFRGPRRFHYHYRHREDDESVLSPVLENPLDTLAAVCRDALRQCRSDLVGLEEATMIDTRRMLENALLAFLLRHKEYKKKMG